MRLRLRITRTGEQPEDREFLLDALKIGRAPSSDLAIPDDRAQTVSWQHARVETNSDGAWIHDLRSTNGTFLNGRRIEQPERLRRGDVVRLGQAGPILEVLDLDPLYVATSPSFPAKPSAPPPPPAPSGYRSAEPPPLAPKRNEPARSDRHDRDEPSRPARSTPSRPMREANDAPVSATRAMLVGMQKKQKTWMVIAGACLCGIFGLIGIILWNHEERIDQLEVDMAKVADLETDLEAVRSKQNDIEKSTNDMYARLSTLEKEAGGGNGEAIYQRTVLSTAWLVTNRGEGSGSVVEHDGKKLIVTAYHVVHQANTIRAKFPKFLNGKVLASQNQYRREGPATDEEPGAISCKVWACDQSLDLAILEPSGLPGNIPALKLAGDSASSGAKVHTIGGHPTGTQGLWSYTSGEVRQVSAGNYRFSNGQQISARIVETTNPVNHGDSGGPLVNNQCQIVGVTSGGVEGANSVAKFIDCNHVRELLRNRPNKPLSSTPAFTPPTLPPITNNPPPAASRDGKVHILLLMDNTCPKIGPSVVRDKDRLMNMFRRGLPAGSYDVDVRMGADANKAYVAQYYRNLQGKVGPNDSVMCYYSGHGGMVKPATHYLCLINGKEALERNFLLNSMRSVGGKATFLITDCCSNYPKESRDLDLNVNEFAANNNFLVPLLLRQRGIVDWQAASPGECALSDIFTPLFCQACASGRYQSWPEIFNDVKNQAVFKTKPIFIRDQRQKQQTPYVFSTTAIRRE